MSDKQCNDKSQLDIIIIQDECMNTIKQLLEKYKNDEYMINRIYSHVVTNLHNTLELESKNHEKRINRNNYLSEEQHVFIQVFLNNNKYFYLPNNNLFFEYDGLKYLIVKEDDIIHKLLSTISKNRVLLQWKYKTKQNIIKQIKERSLFNSIPETDTIQNVLNVLYPAFFSTKNYAKYFLTIIGDNIFKKNQNHIFLVSQKFKQFLNELDNVALASIGSNNTTTNFMTKYHENHFYENCRLIKMNDNFSLDVWRELLKKYGLDLLCVAAHYSKRYENSDQFIENKTDEELSNYSYYLKNNTQQTIIEKFCTNYIIHVENNFKIEWKNLHFVWKQFLSNYNLPNIIYSNTLKNLLREKYSLYDDISDSFIGITSKYLPTHIDFIKFWQDNIIVSNQVETSTFFDNELEIDELASLFKLWAKGNSEILSSSSISEENILKILQHFFPFIEIFEEKYLLNISSKSWNKINDINQSLEYIKDQVNLNKNLTLLSIEDAYNYYYKFCKLNSFSFLVSKRYFEKYLYFKLSHHIVYDKFIQIDTFLTYN
jgi:hypothetical protein